MQTSARSSTGILWDHLTILYSGCWCRPQPGAAQEFSGITSQFCTQAAGADLSREQHRNSLGSPHNSVLRLLVQTSARSSTGILWDHLTILYSGCWCRPQPGAAQEFSGITSQFCTQAAGADLSQEQHRNSLGSPHNSVLRLLVQTSARSSTGILWDHLTILYSGCWCRPQPGAAQEFSGITSQFCTQAAGADLSREQHRNSLGSPHNSVLRLLVQTSVGSSTGILWDHLTILYSGCWCRPQSGAAQEFSGITSQFCTQAAGADLSQEQHRNSLGSPHNSVLRLLVQTSARSSTGILWDHLTIPQMP